MEKAKEIIQKALDYVYEDFDRYVKTQAMEHTVANLGGDLTDAFHSFGVRRLETNPERVVEDAYHYTYQSHGESLGEVDGCEMVEDELKHWMKEAKKNCTAVKKAKLPWTLRNSRDAFERKGHFATK